MVPSNAAVQKAMNAYRRKLPPLSGSDETSHHTLHHRRQTKTAIPQTLIPFGNSRLLALIQKYLKGADGRYYLKDLSGETAGATSIIVGSQSKVEETVERVFDFQPFLPAVAQEPERLHFLQHHREKQPTETIE
jgi:hypothetical protein